jgi:hypothetical protein
VGLTKKLKIMEKKQSSIEWLVDKLNGVDTGVSYHYFNSIIEQAKAMHKEEMKEAHLIADHYPRGYEFDKWYNETFGGEEQC